VATPTLQEQEKLIKLLEKEEQLRIKIQRAKGEVVSKLEEEARLIAVRAEQQEKLIELLELDSTTRNKLLMQEMSLVNSLEDKGRIDVKLAEQKRQQLIEIAALSGTALDNAKKQLVVSQKQLKEQLDLNKAIQTGANAAEDMADSFARALGFGPSLTKNILDAVEAGGKFKDIFGKAGESLKKNFSKTGVIAFAVTNTLQMLKQFDEVLAEVASATGQGTAYASIIENSFDATSRFGTSLAESAESLTALQGSFAGFSGMTTGFAEKLNTSAMLLDRFGAGGEELGQRLNYLQFVLGKTGTELIKFNEDLVKFGMDLQVPPKIITSQYTSLIPKLSLFKDGGTKAFKEVAASAVSMGLDVKNGAQQLFELTEQFMDFESAADKVASINVVLGGSFVNAFDMVMAASKGPIEQVRLLQDAFSAAGKSFDDMGFYERRFLANELGVSFDTLTKIMNGQIKTEEEIKTTEEQMADAMLATADVMKKINSAIMGLTATLHPFITALTPVINALGIFIQYGGDILLIAYGLMTAFSAMTMRLTGLSLSAAITGDILKYRLAMGFAAVGAAMGGFFLGYILFNKFAEAFGEKTTKIVSGALAIAFAIAAIYAAVTVGASALPTIAGLAGLGAAFGAGAMGAFDKTDMVGMSGGIGGSLPNVPSFSDFKAGDSFNDAIVQDGMIHPIPSEDRAMTVLARPGGAIDLTAKASQRRTASANQQNENLTPMMVSMSNTMEKFVSTANKILTMDQPPIEVISKLDGRTISKTVVQNINKDFNLTTDARVPSEGFV